MITFTFLILYIYISHPGNPLKPHVLILWLFVAWLRADEVNNIDGFITVQCSAGKTSAPGIHVTLTRTTHRY